MLHAQPILDLSGADGPARHELLLRMVDDSGDLIPPGTFLYVAERFGLVEEIDRWVVREAVAPARRRGARRPPRMLLGQPLGEVDQDPQMTTFLARRLASTGVDPSGLIFEVTETVAIENVDRAQAVRRASCASSAAASRSTTSAPASPPSTTSSTSTFDYLKIDGEFIKDLPASGTDQLVVRSLVEIARGLGQETIAEFVERRGDGRDAAGVRGRFRPGLPYRQAARTAATTGRRWHRGKHATERRRGGGGTGMTFKLDQEKAIDAIAEVCHLDPDDTEEWRLDRFGVDLGDSIAALADIVFAPRRDALVCPEELIIDVHAILDLHAFPLVVCLWEAARRRRVHRQRRRGRAGARHRRPQCRTGVDRRGTRVAARGRRKHLRKLA